MARTTQQNERPDLTQLVLTAEQIKQLCEMVDGKLSPLDIEMILELTPVGTEYRDFRRYVKRCVTLGLDPTANEIHMEYRYQHGRTQALFVIHVDGYRKMAHATGEFSGFKQAYGDDVNGKYVESIVYRKGHAEPFSGRTYVHEFSDGRGLWATKPLHMTGKTSESLAYKRAFAFSGTITEEEVSAFFDESPQAPPDPPSNPEKAAPEARPEPVQYEIGEMSTGAPEPIPAASEPVRNYGAEYKAVLEALVGTGCTKTLVTTTYLAAYFGVKTTAEIGAFPPMAIVGALLNLQEWLKFNPATVFNANPLTAAQQVKGLGIAA